MKSFKCITLFFSILFLFILASPLLAEEQEEPWTGTLKDGQTIDEKDLKKILADHLRWILYDEGDIVDLQGAKLQGADLNGAKLQGANLHDADLHGANLQQADLRYANLQNALKGAKLQYADLRYAKLQGADLGHAKLHAAHLEYADLKGAYLGYADLKGANLVGAKLEDSYLRDANLAGCIFEVDPKTIPSIKNITEGRNLSQLKYRKSPWSLIVLLKFFKETGHRVQEREITYAIKRSSFENALLLKIKGGETGNEHPDVLSIIEAYLGWFLFDFTCDWGMTPGRPIAILFILLAVLTIPYTVAIRIRNKKDGIWKVWIPERVRTDLGGKKPEIIRLRGFKALRAAFYFSVLSAFNIGWRDFNVGGWIARVQPREYRLQASGWVRSVSGLQSIISVYLLALTILTYFGRPFETY